MWQRLLRLLATSFNLYAFYSNPFRYLLSLAIILLLPYSIFIFWGTLSFLLLMAGGIYLIYRWVKRLPGQKVYHS